MPPNDNFTLGDYQYMGTDTETDDLGFNDMKMFKLPNLATQTQLQAPLLGDAANAMYQGYVPSNLPMMQPTATAYSNPFNHMVASNAQSIHAHQNQTSTLPVAVPSAAVPETMFSAQDEWSCFQCLPPTQCPMHPKTAQTFLEGLERTLNSRESRDAWDSQVNSLDIDGHIGRIVVEPVSDNARDRLMAITQRFLQKAREIHGPGSLLSLRQHSLSTSNTVEEGFAVLPPSKILQSFLLTYVTRLEPYYASVSAENLDADELMESGNKLSSSLLLLLMIAQGASAIPTAHARSLTSGLTEVCRLSLFDLLEKDIALARDPTVLRSALLYINLAVWSGEKWHMDLAEAQRDMYLSMLRHSGLLCYRELDPLQGKASIDLVHAWKGWKEYETKNRMVYSWAILDLEISLFHDKIPKLSISEMNGPLPDTEVLWRARTPLEWEISFHTVHGNSMSLDRRVKAPPSLHDLFRRFMKREFLNRKIDLPPIHLRLLLHPLQALISHLHHCLGYFADEGSHRQSQRVISQFEEVQSLLQNWSTLADRTVSAQENGESCCVTRAMFVMYHLISLNVLTHFPDIERMARGDIPQATFQQSFWARARCVDEAPHIWFHCGQVLRLVRSMPEATKPPWHAGAVYRVALVMWATSIANLANADTTARSSNVAPRHHNSVAVDTLTPEHTAIVRYLRYGDGVPVLSNAKNEAAFVSLDTPANCLAYCVDLLSEEEPTTRLTNGIKDRLGRLFQQVR